MKRRKFITGSAIIGATLAGKQLVGQNSGMISKKSNRKVYRILNADRTKVGTLPILRAFAGDQNDYVSPFVLLDEFGPVDMDPGIDPLRVDAHPHAGVTPTTYFLEGSGHHKDSLNYDFQIGKGEFMMFSSGRGAIHMEETGQKLYEKGGKYHGFQIWLNTPSAHKFDDPTTSVHGEKDMVAINTPAYNVKVILGELFGQKSSIKTLSPAFYYHLNLNANGRIDIPVDAEHNAFVYMINGEFELEGKKKLKANQIALFERGDDIINLFSECGGECLILGGLPLDEVVYSYGPFVMNNQEQIRWCMDAYNSGQMGDPSQVNL